MSCSDTEPEIAEGGGEAVECALDGAQDFADECRLVQVSSVGGPSWSIRHPDGGFRRFQPGDTVSGYQALDGAEPAVSEIRDGYIVMIVGDDRYRWPAGE